MRGGEECLYYVPTVRGDQGKAGVSVCPSVRLGFFPHILRQFSLEGGGKGTHQTTPCLNVAQMAKGGVNTPSFFCV